LYCFYRKVEFKSHFADNVIIENHSVPYLLVFHLDVFPNGDLKMALLREELEELLAGEDSEVRIISNFQPLD
jgi:hypothetical protein